MGVVGSDFICKPAVYRLYGNIPKNGAHERKEMPLLHILCFSKQNRLIIVSEPIFGCIF
jgi:hypothetical protein